MIIKIHNVICQVENINPAIEELLYNKLSYRQAGYIFAPSYKSGRWDGIIHLYYKSVPSRSYGKFWTGLLSQVRKILDDDNIVYELVDCRNEPILGKPLPIRASLAKHQIDAATAVKEYSRGIIKIATAGGKTMIAASLIAELNIPCIFLVHTINLAKQAKKEFETQLGIPVGLLQASNKKLRKFNVATVQTMQNILKKYGNNEIKNFVENECKFMIVDEVQHASSARYKYVIQQFLSAYFRVGLSATPKKDAGVDMQVEGCFGRIIYEAERKHLEETGTISKVHIFYV